MSFDENLINNTSKGMPRLLEIMRALRDPDADAPGILNRISRRLRLIL